MTTDTDEAFVAIKQMQKLATEFTQSGGKIKHLPAYATTAQQTVVVEPLPRKRGRPPKIVVDIAPPPPRKMGRPKTVKTVD